MWFLQRPSTAKPKLSYSRFARALSARTVSSMRLSPFSHAASSAASISARPMPRPRCESITPMPSTPLCRIAGRGLGRTSHQPTTRSPSIATNCATRSAMFCSTNLRTSAGGGASRNGRSSPSLRSLGPDPGLLDEPAEPSEVGLHFGRELDARRALHFEALLAQARAQLGGGERALHGLV